jgi:hypothetical protein
MSAPGVRSQRSVVNTVAQRGYDRIITLEKRCKELKEKETRHCSNDECTTILSKYNDTDFCAQHQRGNIPVPKFL